MKNSQLGWIVAAALGGILIGGGFQPDTGKFGVVDISQVMEKSAAGIAYKKAAQEMTTAREDLLQFVQAHHTVTAEQAVTLHDLTVKPVQTPDDKAKIEEIKKLVLDSQTKNEALQQKQNPTEDDRKLIGYYADLGRKMDETAQHWYAEFNRDMGNWVNNQKQVLIDKARLATQDVGKAQGYLIVFEMGVAPYGANDLTEATTKAMDARK